eukprot:CAMPEP_0171250270 /NCGR_PEP_ID=MMETSP0790-20130122/50009_1 /TAXON_ID=2925 /ORGANISM="Alexandrium catenella, Strain OF101" /LENGTH=41 /DNA_ID= /DNA_START= /DNA_END= /DNA_ORIENTATION=
MLPFLPLLALFLSWDALVHGQGVDDVALVQTRVLGRRTEPP